MSIPQYTRDDSSIDWIRLFIHSIAAFPVIAYDYWGLAFQSTVLLYLVLITYNQFLLMGDDDD